MRRSLTGGTMNMSKAEMKKKLLGIDPSMIAPPARNNNASPNLPKIPLATCATLSIFCCEGPQLTSNKAAVINIIFCIPRTI